MGGINAAFAGYTPEFYQQRAQDYTANYMPQLADQYQGIKGSMISGLADRGQLRSSYAQSSANALEKSINAARQNVVDESQNAARSLQSNVEQQRSNLVSQLNATADPSETARAALVTANQFSAPSTFKPIGDMFTQFANQWLLRQYANAYNPLVQQAQQYSMKSSLPATVSYVR